MSVSRDLLATYRHPGRVMTRLRGTGHREDRALAYLMAACLVVFVAQLPRLAREAHLSGQDLNSLMGGALFGWLFLAPLFFYALSLLSYALMRLLGGVGSMFDARLVLFWAFFASTPLILLHGLTAGFIGPGPQLILVGLAWMAVFLWFWVSGLLHIKWQDA